MSDQSYWFKKEIPGFAARVAHARLEDLDIWMRNLSVEWRDEAQLFQYTHPDEVLELIRTVYALWVKPDDETDRFMLLDNHPDLWRVRQRVGMVMQQLMHTTEVGVALDTDYQPYIRTSTLRADLIVEASADLHRFHDFRTCNHCGGWYPLKRSDSLYCSSRCQTAFWRNKKES